MRGALLLFCLVPACAPVATAAERGSYTYFSPESCASAGKMPKDACANAARNAAAEFEEKAPHYPSRAACEQAYRPGGCSVSFRQGAASGKGVSFTPRQQGFRVTVRSDNDISTIPLAPGLNFAPRPATRLAISIDPRAAGSAAPRAAAGGGGPGGDAVFGTSMPDGQKGPLPPPVEVDPNFDCSKYVEPSKDGRGGAGCLPAPNRAR